VSAHFEPHYKKGYRKKGVGEEGTHDGIRSSENCPKEGWGKSNGGQRTRSIPNGRTDRGGVHLVTRKRRKNAPLPVLLFGRKEGERGSRNKRLNPEGEWTGLTACGPGEIMNRKSEKRAGP